MTLSNFGRVTPTSCQQTVGSQSSARQAERARVYCAKNKQMNWRQNVGLGSVLDLDIVMFLRQVDCCCPVGLSPRRVCSALKIHHKKKHVHRCSPFFGTLKHRENLRKETLRVPSTCLRTNRYLLICLLCSI